MDLDNCKSHNCMFVNFHTRLLLKFSFSSNTIAHRKPTFPFSPVSFHLCLSGTLSDTSILAKGAKRHDFFFFTKPSFQSRYGKVTY